MLLVIDWFIFHESDKAKLPHHTTFITAFYSSFISQLPADSWRTIWFFISLRFMSNHGSNTNRLSLRESLHHWSIRQDVLLPFRISKDSWYVFFYFFIFLFFLSIFCFYIFCISIYSLSYSFLPFPSLYMVGMAILSIILKMSLSVEF